MKKNMKKVMALALAASMTLGMTTAALAVTTGRNETESGTITVSNTVKGQTYTIYQMLTLESWADANDDETNEDGTPKYDGAYAYKVAPDWMDFFTGEGAGAAYVTINSRGYVTGLALANAEAVEEFAKAAKAYAATLTVEEGHQIPENDEDGTVTFSGLNLGYYLLDSTLGALCSIDTTNNDVTVVEKNEEPTVDKLVEEEQGSEDLGKTNDAEIGETVNFETTIHAHDGADQYVLHDRMVTGLELVDDSIVVKAGEDTLVKGTDYTVAFDIKHVCDCELKEGEECENAKHGVCDFEITFADTYLNTIEEDTDIVVTYSAKITDEIEIAGEGNNNDTWLKYGDDSFTENSTTTTYVWEFDVQKYTTHELEEGQTEKLLADAEFVLYYDVTEKDPSDETKEITVRKTATYEKDDTTNTYTFAGWEDVVAEDGKYTYPAAATLTSVADAEKNIKIDGLDSGEYFLLETKAPNGYNLLKDAIEVTIANEDANGAVSVGNYKSDDVSVDHPENVVAANKLIKVENMTGVELPSTGGIGTTIFYVLGSLLVAFSGVVLFAKKRMRGEF